MSNNKQEIGDLISRRTGIIIFISLVVIIGSIIFFIMRNTNPPVSIPSPTISPTVTMTPTSTPTVVPTYNASPQTITESDLPGSLALGVASELSARDWRDTPDSVTLRLVQRISPTFLPKVISVVNKWNWAGCTQTKCIIGATDVYGTIIQRGINDWDTTIVVPLFRNPGKLLPKQTWHIHVVLGADGAYLVTDILGPGFP
jgi:hypothetical protein